MQFYYTSKKSKKGEESTRVHFFIFTLRLIEICNSVCDCTSPFAVKSANAGLREREAGRIGMPRPFRRLSVDQAKQGGEQLLTRSRAAAVYEIWELVQLSSCTLRRENGLVNPLRGDTRALSPAGMFRGKAPPRLAAQKSRPHAHLGPTRGAPAYCLLSLQMGCIN